MRLPARHLDEGQWNATMTPMIDVVFLLLIFFVCTASFQITELLLPTNLDSGRAEVTTTTLVEPEQQYVVVRGTRAAGQTAWSVDEVPCHDYTEVHGQLDRFARRDATLPVVLNVDAQVPLGDMITVYDLSRQVGFERIQFAVSPQP